MTDAPRGALRVSRHAVERLLRPRSLAVVGASDDPAAIGGAPIALLERFGFDGEVHLVSRTRSQINGRACVGSIDDLPEGVDAIILAIPQSGVVEAVEAAGRRGVGGVIVFSSGYAEMDTDGAARQAELATLALRHDVALAGPNCLGLVNFRGATPLTFGDVSPNRRTGGPSLAIISQSGAMSLALTYAAMAQDITMSYAISTGNEAVLGVEDFLDVVLEDSSVRAVAMLIEQIRRPEAFLTLAQVARERGVVLCVLHTGRSVRAQAASLTHTGAIAGDQAVMRAVLEREGVLFIDSLDELIDTAGVVVKCPSPRADGVAFMTDSGAAKTFAIDVSADVGLALPELSTLTLQRLANELPPFAVASNPVDITAMGLNDPSLYGRTAAALLDDEEVGCLVVSAMPGSAVQGAQQVAALVPVLTSSTKPVIYTIMGGESPLAPANSIMILDAGLPLFRSPERALRAARHVTRQARRVRDATSRIKPQEFATLDTTTGHQPNEVDAKGALARAGLRVPRGELVHELSTARAVAATLGYPVIIKIVSSQIVHKSDVGGVAIVTNDEQLKQSFEEMVARVGAARPDAKVDGILIEELLSGGVEVMVGARRDPHWGTLTLVGLGGIWAETLNDAVVISAGAGPAELREAIHSLRGADALRGARGSDVGDIDALVVAVELIGGVLRASPQCVEIEVNPLLVLAQGQGVVALDAWIVPS